MSRRIVLVVLGGWLVFPAAAEPFWIAYEGNDYPEHEGWERVTIGGAAQRQLDDGGLILDTREGSVLFLVEI